jgi:hypothetical protein
LYRAIRKGWPVERAFDLMHSLWQPDDVWSAFIRTALENLAPGSSVERAGRGSGPSPTAR